MIGPEFSLVSSSSPVGTVTKFRAASNGSINWPWVIKRHEDWLLHIVRSELEDAGRLDSRFGRRTPAAPTRTRTLLLVGQLAAALKPCTESFVSVNRKVMLDPLLAVAIVAQLLLDLIQVVDQLGN